jgi:hypothetical protein
MAERTTSVVQFPRDHVRSLMRNARSQSHWYGHKLGRWQTPKSWPWIRDAYCTVCGAMARIETKNPDGRRLLDHTNAKGLAVLESPAEDFLTNEPSVYGDALTQHCPSPDAPRKPRRSRGSSAHL